MKKYEKIGVAIGLIVIVLVVAIAYWYMQGGKPEDEWEGWKNTLIIGTTEYFENPNPMKGYVGVDTILNKIMQGRFFHPDPVDPMKNHPYFASSWEFKEIDGEPVVDVYIKEGMYTWDGQAINASSIVRTWQKDMYLPQGEWYQRSSYKTAEAIDTYTIRFWLNDRMVAPLMAMILSTVAWGWIFSPGVFAANMAGKLSDLDVGHLAGAGTYRIADYVPGESVELEAFDEFFVPVDGPYIDDEPLLPHAARIPKVIIKLYADPSSMRLALEKGEIDIAWKDLTRPDLEDLKKNPDVVVETTPTGYSRYITMNYNVKPLDDVRVRQAIAYAIDLDIILEETQYGEGEVAHSQVHSWMAYYDPIFAETYRSGTREERLQKARSLLDEAGYPNGFTTTYWITSHFDVLETEEKIATILQGQLDDIGVNIEIATLEWGAYNAKYQEGTMEMAQRGWRFDYPDADSDLMHIWSPSLGEKGSTNYKGIYNADEMDYLLNQSRAVYDAGLDETGDNTQRRDILKRVQEIGAEDVITIPLFHSVEAEAFRSYVKGYHQFWTKYTKPIYNAWKEVPEEWLKESSIMSGLNVLSLSLVTGTMVFIASPLLFSEKLTSKKRIEN